jgi:hypothetical protein
MDCTYVAHNREKLDGSVKVIMNFSSKKKLREFIVQLRKC